MNHVQAQFPHDDESALEAFYGKPWNRPELLTHVVPPFDMRYEGALIRGILIHNKCATSLSNALDAIWEFYQHDQAKIIASGIGNYSGAFNYRNVRGSGTKLSCHSFGAAIDIDAEHNPLGAAHGTLAQPVIDIMKEHGATWGGDFIHRKDWMHFQWANEGGPIT